MNAVQNKETMQAIFAELEHGNGKPFVDAMADDFCWEIPGRGAWSRRFEGKQTVRGEAYDNTYCYVCRFENGRLRELTEYMDTALVEAVLAPPPPMSD